jgi:conjugal transfer/entry exclusion protein
VAEILDFLQGHTVSFMLDFLSKELRHLQDEQHAHALALLAEQERCKQEATEAGHREEETERTREHDETFRQAIETVVDTKELLFTSCEVII